MSSVVAPRLVFGWGNPSRGDDALGPLFVERLAAQLPTSHRANFELLTDFQLQVEHALDLDGRQDVLFVDASAFAARPFTIHRIDALEAPTFTTHALTPQALLAVYVRLRSPPPPPCSLLAIRGESFELGAPMSIAATAHLDAALDWAQRDWAALGG